MVRILVLLALALSANALSTRKVIPPRKSFIEPRSNDLDDLESRASCTCGVKTFSKIVGGTYATKNEYPWMAALCYGSPCTFDSQFCGGSLINDQFILTAAHCTEDMTADEITVSLGDHNLASSTETDSAEYQVKKIIMHKRYNSDTYQNDIALLKLTKKVQMTDTIGTICLPPRRASYVGETASISGWGALSSGGSFPDTLKEVDVTVISNEECSNAYSNGQILRGMLCAKEDGKDSCQGDSGGPLVFEDSNGYYEQIGVVSWGSGCADPRYPGVYTEVTKYLRWINRKVKGSTSCVDESPY